MNDPYQKNPPNENDTFIAAEDINEGDAIFINKYGHVFKLQDDRPLSKELLHEMFSRLSNGSWLDSKTPMIDKALRSLLS